MGIGCILFSLHSCSTWLRCLCNFNLRKITMRHLIFSVLLSLCIVPSLASAQSNAFPYCDFEELTILKKLGFTIREIKDHCSGGITADNGKSNSSNVFVQNGWTSLGKLDRFCTAELTCKGAIPVCNPNGLNAGKVIQDRRAHNKCIAQGCSGGSQQIRDTYICR